MSEPRGDFDRLVKSVQRRAWLTRLAEHGGAAAGGVAVGLAAGAAVGWVWPAVAVAIEGTVFVLTGGVLLVTWRNPTRGGTVRRIDEQLRWAELAISAEAARAEPAVDAGMRDALLQLANAASRAARPSDVRVGRWGARAWSGTALAVTALVVWTRLVPTAPRPVAHAAASADVFAEPSPGTSTRETLGAAAEVDAAPHPAQSPSDENGRSSVESVETKSAVAGAATSGGRSSNGAGPGRARGEEASQPVLLPRVPIGAAEQSGPPREESSGSGRAASTFSEESDGSGTVSGSEWLNRTQAKRDATSPRDSVGGTGAPEQTVPARDRDLVRAFHDASQTAGD